MSIYRDTAIYVRVGESQSFVGAARALALTPSAVSKAVTRLERRLGARLILRTTRSLRMTELGVEYFERCRDAFKQLEYADVSIADASLQGTGWLRVEMPTAIGRHVVLPALAQFLAYNLNIKLQVVLCDRPSDLFRGEVDAAIRIGPLEQSELIARRVGEMRRVTCAAPALIARYGAPSTPADLIPQQCIALIDPQSGRLAHWTLSRRGVKNTLVPDSRLVLGDSDAAICAAIHGLGYVQAPSAAVQSHVDAGLLQPVLSDWQDDAPLPIYIVYPNHRQRSVKIKALADFLKTLLPQSARVPEDTLRKQAGYAASVARAGDLDGIDVPMAQKTRSMRANVESVCELQDPSPSHLGTTIRGGLRAALNGNWNMQKATRRSDSIR